MKIYDNPLIFIITLKSLSDKNKNNNVLSRKKAKHKKSCLHAETLEVHSKN